MILQMKILKPIATSILEIVITDDNPVAKLQLGVQQHDSKPNYLYNMFLEGINLLKIIIIKFNILFSVFRLLLIMITTIDTSF